MSGSCRHGSIGDICFRSCPLCTQDELRAELARVRNDLGVEIVGIRAALIVALADLELERRELSRLRDQNDELRRERNALRGLLDERPGKEK